MKTILILASAIFLLSGCDEDKKALHANPSTSIVGEFEGCTVKFIDRGWPTESFFIARCPAADTVTTTNNALVKSGKATVLQRRTVITAEEQQVLDSVKAKHDALAKLTPAERAALGLE